MNRNRADDEAIADVAETLKKLNKRLDKLGSFWLERLAGLLVALVVLLAGWIWNQEGRVSKIEDTWKLEQAAAIGAAVDELRRELTR